MSLRAKIILMMVGAVAALSAAVFGLLNQVVSTQMDASVKRQTATAGRMLSRLLNDHGARLKQNALFVSKMTLYRDIVQAHTAYDQATLDDMADDLCKQLNVDAVLLIGRGSSKRALGTRNANVGIPKPDGTAALDALKGESTVKFVADNGKLRLTAGVPVEISGYVWGAICVSEDVDAHWAEQVSKAVGTKLGLLVEDRVIGLPAFPANSMPNAAGMSSNVSLEDGSYIAYRDRLPYFSGSGNAAMVVLCSAEELLSPYRSLKMAILLASLAALVLAVGLGYAVARGVVGPLSGVVAAAETVRSGDWPMPFQSTRNDEIGLLQAAFDQMTASVKAGQEKLLSLIDIDLLTDLPNHRSFVERMEEEVGRSRAERSTLSLLLLDVDHFAEFNQSQGHAAGDRLLAQTAALLREELPELAVAGRYGGEEFGVLLPKTSSKKALHVAESLRRTLSEALSSEFGVPITFSVGCAKLGEHAREASALVLAAELSLVQAKELGRDRVCQFAGETGLSGAESPQSLHAYLADASLATIQALAAAVDAKDPYTNGHSTRVSEYGAMLAEAIGLSKSEVDLVRISGTLHDVGKIGVPDAVLQKPGRLDDDERKIMETHPVLGELIVSKVPALSLALPGVRHHHERWDGKGYPDGLAGEAIPKIARILAVADTYDAMTSDRPYRKGMPKETALGILLEGAGTQFEPELASSFVEMASRWTQQRAA